MFPIKSPRDYKTQDWLALAGMIGLGTAIAGVLDRSEEALKVKEEAAKKTETVWDDIRVAAGLGVLRLGRGISKVFLGGSKPLQ